MASEIPARTRLLISYTAFFGMTVTVVAVLYATELAIFPCTPITQASALAEIRTAPPSASHPGVCSVRAHLARSEQAVPARFTALGWAQLAGMCLALGLADAALVHMVLAGKFRQTKQNPAT